MASTEIVQAAFQAVRGVEFATSGELVAAIAAAVEPLIRADERGSIRVWIDAEDPDAVPGDGYWTRLTEPMIRADQDRKTREQVAADILAQAEGDRDYLGINTAARIAREGSQ